jgi:hypothetical protein
MLRRAALLLILVGALLALGAVSTGAESLPVGWWNSSPWTRIQAPHTPAGYVRLYEPRSEVIGDLGKPDFTWFVCLRRCDRRLAAQLDSWVNPRTETRWSIIFTRRRNLSTPRTAVAMSAQGRAWAYRGLHGLRRAGNLWLQDALPCRRSDFRIPPIGGRRWVTCTRTVHQRLGGHLYKFTASVSASERRIRSVTISDNGAVARRVDQTVEGKNHSEGVAVMLASWRAPQSLREQAAAMFDLQGADGR